VPLVAAIVVLFIPKENEKGIKGFSTVASLVPLVLSIIVWFGYDQAAGKFQFVERYEWIPSIGVDYHMAVDGISVPLIFLTAFLTTLSLWYSSKVIKVRVKEYFFFFLLLEMGMFGVFTSLNLILFYVFWEVGLVPMYFLIGIWGQPQDRPQYSAIKFFLYTMAGSVAMLLAFLAIYFNTGTFDVVALSGTGPLQEKPVLAAAAFWAIFVAFAIKVPSFPFHTWLPDAHTAAPTAGSVILAGVLLKLGAYGIIRVLLPLFPTEFHRFAPMVAILGIISIIWFIADCCGSEDGWDIILCTTNWVITVRIGRTR